MAEEEKLKELPPNFTPVGNCMYVVRTQAGFRQAIKHALGHNWENEEVYGFPKEYPSFVSISQGYRGYHYVACNSVPLNRVKDIVKDQ